MRRFAAPLAAAILIAGCSTAPIATPTPAPVASPTASAVASPTESAGPTVASPTASASPTVAGLTFAQMIGQKLVIRMDGATPSAALLERIRQGEVGGVILFGANITTEKALQAFTATLREAAAAGGQAPLLIGVDQEGGSIKRIPWAPPTDSPPEMGRIGTASVARSQGASTGTSLRGLGININFAPVADVPASTTSFLYVAGRTFSFDAATTARLADAFASGLSSEGVLPTMKHFPGLGFAAKDTDTTVVTIGESKEALAPGLTPYRTAIGHDIPMIMLSNATYAAYDTTAAAGWSHAIGVTLLRDDLGFTGVTITDSLDGTAHARGVSTASLAVRAANAGTDMLLVTGSEAETSVVYATLLADAQRGVISAPALRASYDRIVALKSGL